MNACRSSHYSSPPPERELCMDGEHRSRRDMSPQGRKRALIRDQPASISGYQTYRKVSRCCHVISIPIRFFPTRPRFPSPFREFNDRSRNGFEGMERLAGFRESSKEATPRNLTFLKSSYFLLFSSSRSFLSRSGLLSSLDAIIDSFPSPPHEI